MTSELFIQQGDHAILLFHAFTSTSKDFLIISRKLKEAGYTIYAPHLSGHGLEDPSQVLNYTMEEWMDDGERALQFLKDKGYQKISVFGLSLGGLVATYLALEHDDIISAGTFSSPTMANSKLNLIPSFKAWYIKKNKERGMDSNEAEKEFENYDKNRLVDMSNQLQAFVRQEMAWRYDTIEKDFFIGQGGGDDLIDENQAKDFAKELENANVTFKWYEGAGHVITVGRTARVLVDDLLNFLR